MACVGRSVLGDNDKERLKMEKRDAFVAKARALIPRVIEAQPARLAKFQTDLQEDIAAWSFACERWGDFLSIRIVRRQYVFGKPGGYATVKHVLALSLSDASPIALRPGRLPDLLGEEEFSAQTLHKVSGKGGEMEVISFPNVDLEDGVDRDAYYRWSSDRLGVRVKGIARPADDDSLVFGEGGGSAWDDCYQQALSGFLFTTPEPMEVMKRRRPGVTIAVPAGLGESTYQAVMKAIAGS